MVTGTCQYSGTGTWAGRGSEEVRDCGRADVNGDYAIDFLDVLDTLAVFGLPGTMSPGRDVNQDGNLDSVDVLKVLAGFGMTCAAARPLSTCSALPPMSGMTITYTNPAMIAGTVTTFVCANGKDVSADVLTCQGWYATLAFPWVPCHSSPRCM